MDREPLDGRVVSRRLRAPKAVLVWPELLEHYQPHIGPVAVVVWLNLASLAGTDSVDEAQLIDVVARRTGIPEADIWEAFSELLKWELVVDTPGGLEVCDPLSGRQFEEVKARVLTENELHLDTLGAADGPGTAGGSSAPTGAKPAMEKTKLPSDESSFGAAAFQPFSEDMPSGLRQILDTYQSKVGLIGPSQIEKLCGWINDLAMEPGAIILAIEEMVQNGKVKTFSYLEGIIRNWHNSGLRTAKKVMESGILQRRGRRSGEPPGKETTAKAGYEGWPNARAYEEVNKEALRKWVEMYGDEYEERQ